MNILKYILLGIIFFISTYIGILISKKYINRVKELKEMKLALNIFKTKVEMMHEPIEDIFLDISKRTSSNISKIFNLASKDISKNGAEEAWKNAVEKVQSNLNKEDIEVIKGLGNLLGKINILGQINQIKLIDNFLISQIEKAEEKRKVNEKLYKTLGIIVGLTIVIVLI